MVTGARESWTYHSHGLERKAMSASTLGARLSLSTLTQFRIQTQKQYCPLSGWLFSNQLITRTSPYRHAHNQNIHLQTRPQPRHSPPDTPTTKTSPYRHAHNQDIHLQTRPRPRHPSLDTPTIKAAPYTHTHTWGLDNLSLGLSPQTILDCLELTMKLTNTPDEAPVIGMLLSLGP